MSYIVVSATKEFLKGKDLMVAGDFPEALSAAVEAVLTKAGERATENGRKTVRPCDL